MSRLAQTCQISDLDEAVDGALARHGGDPTRLLQILIDTQRRLEWLPPRALTRLAKALGLSRARVEGVAGFYSFLYSRPVGRYRVLFAHNIVEEMLDAPALMRRLCERLWIEPGKLSEDGLVSVDKTSCIGMGDQGPSILVNGVAITGMDETRVDFHRRTDPRTGSARGVAARIFRRRRQYPPARRVAEQSAEAWRGAAPRGRGWRRGAAGGGERGQSARSRRRRLRHGAQMGVLPRRARARGPRRRLQRRRGRARHF